MQLLRLLLSITALFARFFGVCTVGGGRTVFLTCARVLLPCAIRSFKDTDGALIVESELELEILDMLSSSSLVLDGLPLPRDTGA